MKTNTHGLKMVGLEKVSDETKKLKGDCGKWNLQLNYNMVTGKIWADTLDSQNPWNDYDDSNIVVIGELSNPCTMQEIADLVSKSVKGRSVIVKNVWNTEIYFDGAVAIMDDEIREAVSWELAPCSEQEFFDAYCEAHEAKYGEPFECAKANPCY